MKPKFLVLIFVCLSLCLTMVAQAQSGCSGSACGTLITPTPSTTIANNPTQITISTSPNISGAKLGVGSKFKVSWSITNKNPDSQCWNNYDKNPGTNLSGWREVASSWQYNNGSTITGTREIIVQGDGPAPNGRKNLRIMCGKYSVDWEDHPENIVADTSIPFTVVVASPSLKTNTNSFANSTTTANDFSVSLTANPNSVDFSKLSNGVDTKNSRITWVFGGANNSAESKLYDCRFEPLTNGSDFSVWDSGSVGPKINWTGYRDLTFKDLGVDKSYLFGMECKAPNYFLSSDGSKQQIGYKIITAKPLELKVKTRVSTPVVANTPIPTISLALYNSTLNENDLISGKTVNITWNISGVTSGVKCWTTYDKNKGSNLVGFADIEKKIYEQNILSGYAPIAIPAKALTTGLSDYEKVLGIMCGTSRYPTNLSKVLITKSFDFAKVAGVTSNLNQLAPPAQTPYVPTVSNIRIAGFISDGQDLWDEGTGKSVSFGFSNFGLTSTGGSNPTQERVNQISVYLVHPTLYNNDVKLFPTKSGSTLSKITMPGTSNTNVSLNSTNLLKTGLLKDTAYSTVISSGQTRLKICPIFADGTSKGAKFNCAYSPKFTIVDPLTSGSYGQFPSGQGCMRGECVCVGGKPARCDSPMNTTNVVGCPACGSSASNSVAGRLMASVSQLWESIVGVFGR